jgi:hypothetical protein
MQRIHRYVAVVSLFVMLGLTGSAIAARRDDDGARARDARGQVQKQKAKPKNWITKILEDLESKVSIPPP